MWHLITIHLIALEHRAPSWTDISNLFPRSTFFFIISTDTSQFASHFAAAAAASTDDEDENGPVSSESLEMSFYRGRRRRRLILYMYLMSPCRLFLGNMVFKSPDRLATPTCFCRFIYFSKS